MKLRELWVCLIVLIMVAVNVHVIGGDSVGSSSQSSGTLVPPLNVTLRAKIDESIAKPSGDLSDFILFDDKACFNGENSHSLYIMDLKTGSIVWSYQTEAKINGIQRYENLLLVKLDYTNEPPAGTLTWASGGGAVLAVDMATRKEAWKFPTKTRTILNLQANDGAVYFISNEEGIYALDAYTGKVKWLHPEFPDNFSHTGKSGFSNLLLVQDTLYTTSATFIGIDPKTGTADYNGTFIALDQATGRERFRFDTGKGALDNLILAEGILYADLSESSNDIRYIDSYNYAGFNHSLVAIDLSTKKFLWKTLLYPFGKGGEVRPIVTADSIYVTGIGMRRAQGERYNPKIVYALDLSSGKIRWGSEQGDYRRDMVLDEPYLYVLGKVKEPTSVGPYGPENRMYATLSAFDTRTGENVWNHTINENGTTSWANTGLYLGNGTGRKIVYLAGYESYYLEKPVDSVIWGTDGVIYGYSSVSTEPVPEFSKTYLLFTIATLALIPVLSRKRWVRHDA